MRLPLVIALGVGLCLVVGPAPAHASCAGSPQASPYRFTGTVIQLANAGRTATVRTDDGRVVIVRGSDAQGPNAATSLDRAYRLNGRYEFDPTNATSPYSDNACTATHPLDLTVTPSDVDQATPARTAGTGWTRVAGVAAILVAARGCGWSGAAFAVGLDIVPGQGLAGTWCASWPSRARAPSSPPCGWPVCASVAASGGPPIVGSIGIPPGVEKNRIREYRRHGDLPVRVDER